MPKKNRVLDKKYSKYPNAEDLEGTEPSHLASEAFGVLSIPHGRLCARSPVLTGDLMPAE